jgi:hypothetical protein
MRSVLFSDFRQRRVIVSYWRFGNCRFHWKILPEPHVFTVQYSSTVQSRSLKSAESERFEDFALMLLINKMLPDLSGAITEFSGDRGAFIFVVKQSFPKSRTPHTSHHTPDRMYFPFKETVPIFPCKGVPIPDGTATFSALDPLWYRPPQYQVFNLHGLFPHKWQIDHSSDSALAQVVRSCEYGNGKSGCISSRESD